MVIYGHMLKRGTEPMEKRMIALKRTSGTYRKHPGKTIGGN